MQSGRPSWQKRVFQLFLVFFGALGGPKPAFYALLAGRLARLRATLHAFLRGFLDFTTFAKTEKPRKNAWLEALKWHTELPKM